MRGSLILLLLSTPGATAQLEALLEAPPAAMHINEDRAFEISHLEEGDVVPSTQRKLCYTGRPKDRLADLKAWATAALPSRTRDYHNHHFNSDKWDLVTPRPDDVVVATAYKSGTTWMQVIILNLLYGGKVPEQEGTGMMDLAPWVDLRIPPPAAVAPTIEANTDRRCLKTHLPLDGVKFSETSKYIVVTRDLRDVAYSWHNHLNTAFKSKFWGVIDALPGRAGPSIMDVAAKEASPHDLFLSMIDDKSDGAETGVWSYFHHLGTWWLYRHLPNIMFVHYSTMKKDPKGTIKKVADFIGVDASDELVELVATKTSFGQMKEDATKILGPAFDGAFKTKEDEVGARNFIFKGTNGRWRDDVTTDEIEKYTTYAVSRLGPAGMKWLTEGVFSPGYPQPVEDNAHPQPGEDKSEL